MLKIISVGLVFLIPQLVYSQNTKSNVGHCIGRVEFDKLVNVYMDSSVNSNQLTLDDAFIMIRLFNTIAYDTSLRKSSHYGDYSRKFILRYGQKVRGLIEASHSKGMSLYSRKYDLYIGGPPHANSRYNISDK